MSKRYTDTEKFTDPWYRRLDIKRKCLWEYLLAECNHAGIFNNFDLETATFKIGAEITEEDILFFGDRVVVLDEKTLFIPKFIKFQYGELNPANKVHASVLKELSARNLDPSMTLGRPLDDPSMTHARPIDDPSLTLGRPYVGSKDKEKDKEKEKEKENIEYEEVEEDKEKVKEEVKDNRIVADKREKPASSKAFDPYNKGRFVFNAAFEKVFGKKALLTSPDCLNLYELSCEFDDFYETLPEVLEVLSKLDFKGWKPSANWVLQGKNYTDIRNGVYDEVVKKARGEPLADRLDGAFKKLEAKR